MVENQTSKPSKKQEEALEKLNKFLQDNSIKLAAGISFPIYRKYPVELELAMQVIQRHEPEFEIQVVVQEDEKKVKGDEK